MFVDATQVFVLISKIRQECESGITATFTGPPERSLLPETAEPAAPRATYCYHARSGWPMRPRFWT